MYKIKLKVPVFEGWNLETEKEYIVVPNPIINRYSSKTIKIPVTPRPKLHVIVEKSALTI